MVNRGVPQPGKKLLCSLSCHDTSVLLARRQQGVLTPVWILMKQKKIFVLFFSDHFYLRKANWAPYMVKEKHLPSVLSLDRVAFWQAFCGGLTTNFCAQEVVQCRCRKVRYWSDLSEAQKVRLIQNRHRGNKMTGSNDEHGSHEILW